MSKLKLNFDRPVHGWVPVKLELEEKIIEFEGSYINNPIHQLMEALWKIVRGDSSEVWWNLEPDGYFFTFERNNENIIFRVFFSTNSELNNRREILYVEGGIREVALPIWRGLKRFLSYDETEPHWPEISSIDIVNLGKKIKNE